MLIIIFGDGLYGSSNVQYVPVHTYCTSKQKLIVVAALQIAPLMLMMGIERVGAQGPIAALAPSAA